MGLGCDLGSEEARHRWIMLFSLLEIIQPALSKYGVLDMEEKCNVTHYITYGDSQLLSIIFTLKLSYRITALSKIHCGMELVNKIKDSKSLTPLGPVYTEPCHTVQHRVPCYTPRLHSSTPHHVKRTPIC